MDLNSVVRGIGPLIRRLIGENIEFRTVLASALGRMKADPGQIEQGIMNLAINARDDMPDGGKLIVETANSELDDAYVRQHPGVAKGPYVMLSAGG